MARKVSSTMATLLAATTAIAMATLSPISASASSGTLFGLNPSPGAVFAIDPASGATTKLTDLPADPSGEPPTFSGLASDAAHHLLYTIRAFYTDATFTKLQTQVVTIDSQTGATSLSPALAQDVPSDIAFDPTTGSLLGITGVQSPQSVVRVDPVSGAITHIADLPATLSTGRFAFDPAKHSMWVPIFEFVNSEALNVVVTVDTATGTVSQSPGMTLSINQLLYDSSSGALFGDGGFPPSVYQIDTATGAQTLVAPLAGGGFFFPVLSIDSSTHTIFVKNDDFSTGSDVQTIQSLNDVTGASSVSTGGLTTDFYVNTLVFEGAAAITPDSVAADVKQSFSSGAC